MTPSILLLFVASTGAAELFPGSLLYAPYLAGSKEARLSDIKLWEEEQGALWDITLGGRAGMVRFDVSEAVAIQIDIEGAAFVRLDLDDDRDLLSSEFRYGIQTTYRLWGAGVRFGWYHLSAHLGDEAASMFPGRRPNGYSRDAFVLGLSYTTEIDVRLYGEVEWGFVTSGPAEPFQIQLGASWSPQGDDAWGRPFLAMHGWLRQEEAFAPSVTLQAGWAWRVKRGGPLYRFGAHYLRGPSPAYQFLGLVEQQIGFGAWFDF